MTTRRGATAGVTRALAYCRVSTDGQADSGLSLDHQKATIRAEAERRGWELVEIVVDVGSGKSLDRPLLAAALEVLRAGRADVLVSTRLDRISRSTVDFLGLLERSRREGWSLVVLDLGLDLGSASGELVASVLASMATFERRLISARTSEALQAAKARGRRLGGPRAMPHEVDARIVAMRASGLTLAAIAETLNAEGVPTSRGGARWYASTIHRALGSNKLDQAAEALASA